VAAESSASPDLRAYLLYVASRYAPIDIEAATALLDDELHIDSLAYLALALPLDQAEQLRMRLNSQVRRSNGTAYWESPITTPVAHSRLATSALVVSALRRIAPDDALHDGAIELLHRGWSLDGWPTSYDSARVAATLLADWQGPSAAALLSLDGQSLINADAPITTTSRISLNAAQVATSPLLRIEAAANAPDAAFLLAMVPAAFAALPEPLPLPNQAFALNYADPTSGRILDPADLRVGQFVEVRATLVTARPLLLPAFIVPLPAGLLLLDAAPTPPFVRSVQDDPAAVRFVADELRPGVYTQRYRARVGQPGMYGSSPLQLTPLFEPANAIFSADPGRISVGGE
jgi:hypothetical protein